MLYVSHTRSYTLRTNCHFKVAPSYYTKCYHTLWYTCIYIYTYIYIRIFIYMHIDNIIIGTDLNIACKKNPLTSDHVFPSSSLNSSALLNFLTLHLSHPHCPLPLSSPVLHFYCSQQLSAPPSPDTFCPALHQVTGQSSGWGDLFLSLEGGTWALNEL